MGAYAGAIVTNAGQNLIAAAIANSTTVEFTRVESSSWEIPSGTNIQTLAALQDVEQTVAPSSVGVYNNNVIQVLANFDNSGVSTAYLIQTLGVWAKEGSSSEVLFAVIQATTPDQMPVESAVSPSSFIYRIQMTVNNASTVNMTVSSAGTLTTADFDKVYKLTDWTTITSSEDLDNYTTAGNFVCATDAIAATLNNAPDVYAFSLKVEVNTVGAIMQIAREITGKTWFRCYTSAWSAWTVISAPNVFTTDGGTITGSLNVNGSIGVDSNMVVRNQYHQHFSFEKGTMPSSDEIKAIGMEDSTSPFATNANDRLGAFSVSARTNGTVTAQMQAYKNIGNSTAYAQLRVNNPVGADSPAIPEWYDSIVGTTYALWHGGNLKIQNNLTTTEAGSALDARQGKALNDSLANRMKGYLITAGGSKTFNVASNTRAVFFSITGISSSAGAVAVVYTAGTGALALHKTVLGDNDPLTYVTSNNTVAITNNSTGAIYIGWLVFYGSVSW